MLLMTDIHVRSFTGSGIKPYVHSIAKLRMEIFREYPYFEEPHLERELQYLNMVCSCKEAISVLIFDGTTLVGVSLGLPLSIEEPAVLLPFKDKHLDTDSYFFFGDSALLKQYRGRGIGHHFFDAREAHVQQFKKYKHICFCVPFPHEENEPQDYIPLDDFWRKRGYIHHPDMRCTLAWVELGKTEVSTKQMSFWIKDLH